MPSFSNWYVDYDAMGRDGSLEFRAVSPEAAKIWHEYEYFKREMDARVHGYDVLERIADA